MRNIIVITILCSLMLLIGAKKQWSKKQYACVIICMVYMYIVFLLTIALRSPYAGTHLKLVPFWNLIEIHKYGARRLLREILINIVLLLPIGFVLRAGFFTTRTRTIIVAGFFLSLLIELLQFASNRGAFEMNDLFFNTIGIYLGDLSERKILECYYHNNDF